MISLRHPMQRCVFHIPNYACSQTPATTRIIWRAHEQTRCHPQLHQKFLAQYLWGGWDLRECAFQVSCSDIYI